MLWAALAYFWRLIFPTHHNQRVFTNVDQITTDMRHKPAGKATVGTERMTCTP